MLFFIFVVCDGKPRAATRAATRQPTIKLYNVIRKVAICSRIRYVMGAGGRGLAAHRCFLRLSGSRCGSVLTLNLKLMAKPVRTTSGGAAPELPARAAY